MHRRGHRAVLVAATLSVSLIASSCGDSGGDAGSSAASGTGGSASSAPAPGAATTTTLAPQRGGVVAVGEFTSPAGLDPTKLAGTTASIGGMELAAIYDTVMRFDPLTGAYEPHTAESMKPNADFTQWTLKLKPNVKFTDGTEYNADAVKFTIDRELKEGNAQVAGQLRNFIASVTVVDPLTITFALKLGWTGFPYLLSGAGGMIYSPTAFQKAGANFNVAPGDAGAGPFKVKSYKPNEALELERNTSYYGGEVYLDGMRFTLISGASATYDAITSGTLQAGFTRDPVVNSRAKAEGFGTVDIPAVGGSMAVMNSGIVVTCAASKPASLCTGQPDGTKVPTKTATADVAVRRAVAAAIDVNAVNQRVYSGKAQATNSPFSGTPFDPKVSGPTYDLANAKQLVAAAKAGGWDGKIRVLAGNDPTSTSWALAVSTLLQAAGMVVATDTSKSIQDVTTQVLVDHDFDLVSLGFGLTDEADGNYTQLFGALNSKDARYGYGTPELDAAIDSLRTADSDAKRADAFKKIAEIWVKDDPSVVIANLTQSLITTPKLHGVVRNAQQNIIFDKAWLEH